MHPASPPSGDWRSARMAATRGGNTRDFRPGRKTKEVRGHHAKAGNLATMIEKKKMAASVVSPILSGRHVCLYKKPPSRKGQLAPRVSTRGPPCHFPAGGRHSAGGSGIARTSCPVRENFLHSFLSLFSSSSHAHGSGGCPGAVPRRFLSDGWSSGQWPWGDRSPRLAGPYCSGPAIAAGDVSGCAFAFARYALHLNVYSPSGTVFLPVALCAFLLSEFQRACSFLASFGLWLYGHCWAGKA